MIKKTCHINFKVGLAVLALTSLIASPGCCVFFDSLPLPPGQRRNYRCVYEQDISCIRADGTEVLLENQLCCSSGNCFLGIDRDCDCPVFSLCSRYWGSLASFGVPPRCLPYFGSGLLQTSLTHGLFQSFKPTASTLRDHMFAQSAPVGQIILTPVADGTVDQIVVNNYQPDLSDLVLTAGPTRLVTGRPIEPADQQAMMKLEVRGSHITLHRHGLVTGGARQVRGLTVLGKDAQIDYGAAGVMKFDLSHVKTAVQQWRVPMSAVRATLRLTPIRSLNALDIPTDATTTAPPLTTRVVLLEANQPDLIVDSKDFPGFASPAVSNLGQLEATINNVRPGQRATLRTDLLGLLQPLQFDVTESVQRAVRALPPTAGFQVVSELNGTGLIFADSSLQIPGIASLIAPHLILELTGYTPPGQARLLASTTRIEYDSLARGFSDMTLVTINNIGGSQGSIALDLTSGSTVFGLITPDGRPLNAQGTTATIAAGDRLIFGVVFKPGAGPGQSFQGALQVTETTGGGRQLLNRIALTGATLPPELSQNNASLTVPVSLPPLADQAARVGDLNSDGLIDAIDVGQLSAIVTDHVPAPQPRTTAFAVADVNGDGAITTKDANILGDVLARNLPALPRLRPSSSEMAKNTPAAESTLFAPRPFERTRRR